MTDERRKEGTKQALIRIEKNREKIRDNSMKRARRLINALEHVKTANTHTRLSRKGILENWLSIYESQPEKWDWGRTLKLRESCELAEGFLYRVIKKYD